MIIKTFEIKRHSFLTDDYDDGITEREIEIMLNRDEENRPGHSLGKWYVKEIKK